MELLDVLKKFVVMLVALFIPGGETISEGPVPEIEVVTYKQEFLSQS